MTDSTQSACVCTYILVVVTIIKLLGADVQNEREYTDGSMLNIDIVSHKSRIKCSFPLTN